MNNLNELARLMVASGNPEQIAQFLQELLTPSEIDGISSRWELVKRLDAGQSQRAIASELHLSLCKITRGSRELKRPQSALRAFLELRENLD